MQEAGPFPVLFLTGPRRSGKTTLARAAFPDHEYLSLEDPQRRAEALEDPRGLLQDVRTAGERPRIFFWRDSHGVGVDVLLDLGARRVPVEIKAGMTVAADAFRGLEAYQELRGTTGGGALVYAGTEHYGRRGHEVMPWYACT